MFQNISKDLDSEEEVEINNNQSNKKIQEYKNTNQKIKSLNVLQEFMSTIGEEEKLLQQDEYQSRLAWGIYTGIMNYFYEN